MPRTPHPTRRPVTSPRRPHGSGTGSLPVVSGLKRWEISNGNETGARPSPGAATFFNPDFEAEGRRAEKPVAQTSQSAVSQVSKPARLENFQPLRTGEGLPVGNRRYRRFGNLRYHQCPAVRPLLRPGTGALRFRQRHHSAEPAQQNLASAALQFIICRP